MLRGRNSFNTLILFDIRILAVKFIHSSLPNCWDAMRDMEEIYEIGLRWSFLKPLLINMIEVPEHLKPPEEPEA